MKEDKKKCRIVMVGGGYAGLAALVALRERAPEAGITLIDPSSDHVKLTQLHESFREPSASFRVPYPLIENRFGISHIPCEADLTPESVAHWNQSRRVIIEGETPIDFDYIILSVGAGLRNTGLKHSIRTLTLEDFAQEPGPSLLHRHLDHYPSETPWITLVGSGATGVQFLFEITYYIASQQLPWKIRLVDAGSKPLQQLGDGPSRYVRARLDEMGIPYIPEHYFLQQGENAVTIESKESFERTVLPSALTLYFSGKNHKDRWHTNAFGQVSVNKKTLKRVFAAGDCAHFHAPGSNALSAQSAVRKGQLVGYNLLRHRHPFGLMRPYLHRDLGYIVSMGPQDAIGWVGRSRNIIAGKAALSLKDLVESQYDLLLAGTNTFSL